MMMGWSIGYDERWHRDIGYGVPAICDHPGCHIRINRGLGHVCGGEPFGGEDGCGLFFCEDHRHFSKDGTSLCERCCAESEPFDAKPDPKEWMRHKLSDPSWAEWRKENPGEVRKIRTRLGAPKRRSRRKEG